MSHSEVYTLTKMLVVKYIVIKNDLPNTPFIYLELCDLIFKVPSKIAADGSPMFLEKIRHDISCYG